MCFGLSISFIFSLLVFFVCSSALNVYAPIIFARMIDQISIDNVLQQVIYGLILYAVLMGLSMILREVVTYSAVVIAEMVNYIASTQFFKKITLKNSNFFIEHHPAEIQAMQSQGTLALNKVIQLCLMLLVPGGLQIIFACFVLGMKLNLQIMLIVIVYGIFYITFAYYSNSKVNKYIDSAVEATQQNVQLMGNAMSMIETLRYFNATQWMDQRFENGAKKIFESWKNYSIKTIYYAIIFGLALTVQFLITFYLLIPQYKVGVLTVGDLVLFNTLLLQLNRPFEMIGMSIQRLMQAYLEFKPFAKMWNADEFKDENVHLQDEQHLSKLEILEFNNVSFFYENGRGIEHIYFKAKKGQITFLLGESGAGKSTILKLALKQLEPNGGEILIDGINLKDIHRNGWFSKIGIIPQEVMLLNDSVKTNICLGRVYDKNKLYQAAEKAKILNRILDMPNGFDTVVGERGMTLSGGEKQRIAIARALYEKPNFLFLDEASSSLDQDTEAEIMEHIRELAIDITIVAITHHPYLITKDDVVVKV